MSDIPNVSRQFWHIAAFHWEESIYEALGNNLPNGSDHNIKSSSLTYTWKTDLIQIEPYVWESHHNCIDVRL